MIEQILWVILPYIVITIFIGGHIYRYQHDQFGWTAKSSEMLEKKKLALGSSLFHWGIFFVIGGHVMGILIPESLYQALGVSEHMYHKIAIGFGLPAGIAALSGLIILTYRRFTDKRIRKTSSAGDFITLVALLFVMTTGLAATFLNIDSKGFDYRTTISPWFRNIFLFKPDAGLMASVPLWFKLHIMMGYVIFIIWPFTRLVHVFSMPLKYLTRSYVVYRKRAPRKSI
ncbi:respiratory nitrate reductase subunit gamma [Bacillus paralicheniformis]|uniref:respiratory nitrate reductase subunit gamma n=1 Tax=Bacillus paralicheniformis TaxID=1648923 RepID=UPI0022801A0E|nr:respiratory nitrate reductase subunit gamma [Bacillus paralicheniformis]MCY8038477.1 respiratory nitrate reductase subunit gamma [Bacillus paralicheniformis]MCY8152596.1 respiratory nitrate reductase subunit gamma [Bacillus paralicheniformis]MCY8180560.1 respiratory nitrate reductase subunit gamma [Bacillus paralicheniformis]MCY9423236.1 respiratory nitrate reductase subunit gamma [Bacillus paralicheniformis]MEC0579992.1 respiratory nitrate reductase subunit gamma [Bacillus paralicheniformi